MSIRDEVWQAFLGRALTHDEMHDQAVLCDRLQLQDNDPFWGIIAFFYFQTRQLYLQQQVTHKELIEEIHTLHNKSFNNKNCTLCLSTIEQKPLYKEHNNLSKFVFKFEHYLLILLIALTVISIIFTVTKPSMDSFTPSNQNELINWGNINPKAKIALLNCKFSNQSRIVEQFHHHICYPAGEGIGYYLNK